MHLTKTARNLYEGIAELPVINAHEHLPAEAEYLAFDYSGLNMFAGYIWHDLVSAGLNTEFKETMRNGGPRPVDAWWPVIRPYWEQVRHGSYARALRITARELFGIDDINDTTIKQFAEAVTAANTPGLYYRILQQKCGIETTITCIDKADFPDDPDVRSITQLLKCTGTVPEIQKALSKRSGTGVSTLDDAIAATRMILTRELELGAVGFKLFAAPSAVPDMNAAVTEWKQANMQTPVKAVYDILLNEALTIAANADVPVAVHTGYWGDFRELDPKHLLGLALQRPDVRFDLFHLGMPMIRDAIMISKTLPNVTLNLAWCPVISQVQTVRALDEIIDMVPLNKIIAFGGDYRCCIQKTYGHLVMARETVAAALGARVDAQQFDTDEALRIARMWFYDNPNRIYGLNGSDN